MTYHNTWINWGVPVSCRPFFVQFGRSFSGLPTSGLPFPPPPLYSLVTPGQVHAVHSPDVFSVVCRSDCNVKCFLLRHRDGSEVLWRICLSARITRKPHGRTSQNFPRTLSVVVAWSSSDGVAIRYILPVLWMMSSTTLYLEEVRQVWQYRRTSRQLQCLVECMRMWHPGAVLKKYVGEGWPLIIWEATMAKRTPPPKLFSSLI